MSEQQLNDASQNFVRLTQLITVRGAVVPNPYGGKQRQMMINMDQRLLQQKQVSATDVLSAVNAQNLVMPSGSVNMGTREYDVRTNAAARSLAELANIPIKQIGATTLYLRDVATVSDGFAVQTNMVRQDGRRSVLVAVLKGGRASTLEVVAGARKMLPRIAAIAPPEMVITLLSDQSVFVSGAINSVIREGIVAAALTGFMILVFLGSWRSTLIIASSIPLAILTSLIVLSLIGQTMNIMTLGGLALAVGILVDDATVEIENIHRNLAMGKNLRTAILDGAQQIAAPAFVATLCICIVFLPMFMLGGVARYLFVPLAEAVIFAMLASYFLSRNKPVSDPRALPAEGARARPARRRLFRAHATRVRAHAFERLRPGVWRAARAPGRRAPDVRAGLSRRLPAGLRAHPDARAGLLSECRQRRVSAARPRRERDAHRGDGAPLRPGRGEDPRGDSPRRKSRASSTTSGSRNSPMNTMHMTSGALGPNDADILVSLNAGHHPTADYQRRLRERLAREFPGVIFYFLPADIVTQILNFGIPAPMDIQIEGKDVAASHRDRRQVARGAAPRPRPRGSPPPAAARMLPRSIWRSTAPRRCKAASPSTTSPAMCSIP